MECWCRCESSQKKESGVKPAALQNVSMGNAMATPTLGTFLSRLKQAMATETLASRSDQELIEEFRSGRDEAIFRAIMERHGQMVFHVCRRVLSSATDVEDAFQSTFLTLIRRGHTVRRHASLASWLHGVAWRTASSCERSPIADDGAKESPPSPSRRRSRTTRRGESFAGFWMKS